MEFLNKIKVNCQPNFDKMHFWHSSAIVFYWYFHVDSHSSQSMCTSSCNTKPAWVSATLTFFVKPQTALHWQKIMEIHFPLIRLGHFADWFCWWMATLLSSRAVDVNRPVICYWWIGRTFWHCIIPLTGASNSWRHFQLADNCRLRIRMRIVYIFGHYAISIDHFRYRFLLSHQWEPIFLFINQYLVYFFETSDDTDFR